MHKIVDIRRNDNVRVITGRDKGKEGRVLRVSPAKGTVLVEHVMMVKKAVRKNPQKNVKGGIAEQEPDQHQQRDAGVHLVQAPDAGEARKAWRKARARVPALRDDVREITASRQIDDLTNRT